MPSTMMLGILDRELHKRGPFWEGAVDFTYLGSWPRIIAALKRSFCPSLKMLRICKHSMEVFKVSGIGINIDPVSRIYPKGQHSNLGICGHWEVKTEHYFEGCFGYRQSFLLEARLPLLHLCPSIFRPQSLRRSSKILSLHSDR